MPALSWLSRLVHAFTRKFTRRKSRARFRWGAMDRLHTLRLRLEGLEDRMVPTTFTVLNANNSGAGSLRQAVLNANANVGVADTIVFGDGSGTGGTNFLDATPDTIFLTSGTAITFTDAALTTVVGTGEGRLTVDGSGASRVFDVNPGAAAVSGMTITGGDAGGRAAAAGCGSSTAGRW